MARKLKVYGGRPMNPTTYKQERCVVAVYSQRELAQILGCSLYGISGWWCITGNKEEIEMALAKPRTPIWAGKL